MNIIETNLTYKEMTRRNLSDIDMLIYHHRAGQGTAESIHDIHLNRGFAGAGYNFYIRKDGSIYRLRDINYVPAAAQGSNTRSINICFEGNLDNEEMTLEQIRSGQELTKEILKKYTTIKYIKCHRDVNNTSCPGSNFKFDEVANGTVAENTTTQEATGTIANIQKTLNERYSFAIAVDNLYGNETKTALVKALQTELNKQFGRSLVIDGIFGPATKTACINVRKGAQGNITWLIQAMLVCQGYNIEVDSIFGSNTENAVKDWQSRCGISVDGIVGKNTFEKLFK